jgi:hypothetical protein
LLQFAAHLMSYLKNIVQQSGGNRMGGVLTLQVARKAEVEKIPAPVNGVVYGTIQLRPGAQLCRWTVGYQSAGITTQLKTTREGPTKESELEFFIPNDPDEIRSMLETASLDEFIVLFQYPNSVQKIFGHLQAPVRFSFDHNSGTNTADRHGYICRFFYNGPDNSFFYRGDLPAAPVGPAPVIVKFNGVAIASLAPGETLNITSDYSFDEYFVTQ